MLIQVLISSLLLFATTGLPANACPSEEVFPGAYSRRDDNRCEGIPIDAPVSSSFGLVSFTSSTRRPLSSNLKIKVHNPLNEELNIVLGSIRHNYWVDEMAMTSENSVKLFNLPTGGLRGQGVSINTLYAIAKSGPQVIYYPVILQEPVDSYSFIFYSFVDKAEFIKAEIKSGDGQLFHRWGEMQSASLGEKAFDWSGPSSVPEGLYEFHYIVKLESTSGEINYLSGSVPFIHNPVWLQ